MAVVIKYSSASLTILADYRNHFVDLGDHDEWRQQFRKAISSPKVHQVLDQKLTERFSPLILCYSKIIVDPEQIRSIANKPTGTICVIGSVGEHAITPWMIIHNIAHTYLSWYITIKKEIIKILNLDPIHFKISDIQDQLVDCASARCGKIPNINELIYELFTTWIWFGRTKSPHAHLRSYCDRKFEEVVNKYSGKTVWHKYRPPTPAIYGCKCLESLIR